MTARSRLLSPELLDMLFGFCGNLCKNGLLFKRGLFGSITIHNFDNVFPEYVEVLPDVPPLLQMQALVVFSSS